MKQKIGISLDWQKDSDPTYAHPLGTNELHLWWLPLSLDKTQNKIALSLLSDIQRDKYHRRNNKAQKQAYLAGRYHLLTLLGAYSACKPDEVLLSYSRLNKPYMDPNPAGIQFNFTDTIIKASDDSKDGHYMGLFAFCLNREVGVDVEALNRVSDFKKIAERRFTDAEQTFIKSPDGSIDQHKALAIWTRKEAYGKATGQGINFTMRERELVNDDKPIINFKDDTDKWRLTQLQLSDSHIGCVVHQGHSRLTIKGFMQPRQTLA